MKMSMTVKDVRIMRATIIVLFLILFVRFCARPGFVKFVEAQKNFEEAHERFAQADRLASQLPALEADRNKNMDDLKAIAKPYYAEMPNKEIDGILTSLAIKHDLVPQSLSISDPETMIINPYMYSEGGVTDAVSSLVSEAEPQNAAKPQSPLREKRDAAEAEIEKAASGVSDDAGNITDSLQQSLPLMARVTVTAKGSRKDALEFYNDLVTNHKSIHVASVSFADEENTDAAPEKAAARPGQKKPASPEDEDAAPEIITTVSISMDAVMCRSWMKEGADSGADSEGGK